MNGLTEREVAELVGVTPARVGQLRRGRVSRRGGRIEYREEPRLEPGTHYYWNPPRVLYTPEGVERVAEIIAQSKPKGDARE